MFMAFFSFMFDCYIKLPHAKKSLDHLQIFLIASKSVIVEKRKQNLNISAVFTS